MRLLLIPKVAQLFVVFPALGSFVELRSARQDRYPLIDLVIEGHLILLVVN